MSNKVASQIHPPHLKSSLESKQDLTSKQVQYSVRRGNKKLAQKISLLLWEFQSKHLIYQSLPPLVSL